MFNRVSADGSFASADGRLDWVVPEPELDRAAAGSTGGFDTILFGRRTYDLFASFWPQVLSDAPDAPNPHAPGRSPEMLAVAVMLDESRKLVFSRGRPQLAWSNTHLLGAFDAGAVAAMKQQAGKDIIVFGSGAIVLLLTQHGLIDEYQLVVSPLLLGGGRRLFGGLTAMVPLQLLEAKSYPSGNVMLRYAPRGG